VVGAVAAGVVVAEAAAAVPALREEPAMRPVANQKNHRHHIR